MALSTHIQGLSRQVEGSGCVHHHILFGPSGHLVERFSHALCTEYDIILRRNHGFEPAFCPLSRLDPVNIIAELAVVSYSSGHG